MDHDLEQERRTYQFCQMGFGALSVALVIATIDILLCLPLHFRAPAFLPWLVGSTFWEWLGSVVVFGSLLGTYLLVGRFTSPGWQRRSGLLLLMCGIDAVLWGFDHADALGLGAGAVEHRWFRYSLGQALGWAEFALLASLASDLLVHLGVSQAAETGRSARSLAATGAVVWMVLFLLRTDWNLGWPLGIRRWVTLETLVLDLGSTLIWAITLVQVTALTIAATRQCASVVAEIARQEKGDHLFERPAEAEAERELQGTHRDW